MCRACFGLRLGYTAREAARGGFEYFTTTLSVSPHKNADSLNRIGEAAGREAGVKYLTADFKKKYGYLRSLQLSREYGLYRQDYCGCLYSKPRKD
jgi:predicted adenine nucleotide alpha hydrolase (AANH) superfamily ATPase